MTPPRSRPLCWRPCRRPSAWRLGETRHAGGTPPCRDPRYRDSRDLGGPLGAVGETAGAVRVVVTRPVERAGELVARLQSLGLKTEACPLIAIEPSGPPEVPLSGYDWVVVTSRTAAEQLAARA